MPATTVRGSTSRSKGMPLSSDDATQPESNTPAGDRAEERADRSATETFGVFEDDHLRDSALDAAVSDEERRRMISEAACFIAQRRGFDGGLELEDWLAAESEVNARLASLWPQRQT